MLRVGVCAAVNHAPALKAAGADYIEENAQNYLVPERPDFTPATFPIPVRAANCFLPGALKCTGPQMDAARILRYAETAFRRAAQAGIEVIVFGSGGARQIPDGFSAAEARRQFVSLLQQLGPLAGKHGVTIVVEPLNRGECNFINTVDEGAEIVEECSHPRVRLLADLFHMLRNGESPDALRRHGALMGHVHVAECAERTPPGVAGDDFRPFLRELRGAGYSGGMSIECQWKELNTQAAPAIAELRRQWEESKC